MVGRTLTAGMQTELESNVIRPVLIARFDILTDPLSAWTGPGTFAPSGSGDTALDGQIFVNMAPFIELTDVSEDQGIGNAVQLTVSGHDLDFELLRQIVRDKRQWRGRSAWLWLGLLNADEATVVSDPVRIKTAVMSQMIISRKADESSVTITLDKDLGRALGIPWRWIDHARLYPTDTWSTFIVRLANQPGGFTDRPLQVPFDSDPDGPNPQDEFR